jgi:hypothetical protein
VAKPLSEPAAFLRFDGIPGSFRFESNATEVECRWEFDNSRRMLTLTPRQAAAFLALSSKVGEGTAARSLPSQMAKIAEAVRLQGFTPRQSGFSLSEARDFNRRAQIAGLPMKVTFVGPQEEPSSREEVRLQWCAKEDPPLFIDRFAGEIRLRDRRITVSPELHGDIGRALLGDAFLPKWLRDRPRSPREVVQSELTRIIRHLGLPARVGISGVGEVRCVWSAGVERKPFFVEPAAELLVVLPPSSKTGIHTAFHDSLQYLLSGGEMPLRWDAISVAHPLNYSGFRSLQQSFRRNALELQTRLDELDLTIFDDELRLQSLRKTDSGTDTIGPRIGHSPTRISATEESGRLYRSIEAYLPPRTRPFVREAVQSVLSSINSPVITDQFMAIWQVDSSRDTSRKVLDDVWKLLHEPLAEQYVHVIGIDNGFMAVETSDLSIEPGVEIDGKSLTLRGPNGSDESPLSVPHYLAAQALVAENEQWIDAKVMRAKMWISKRPEARILDDLAGRLEFVGAKKKIWKLKHSGYRLSELPEMVAARPMSNQEQAIVGRARARDIRTFSVDVIAGGRRLYLNDRQNAALHHLLTATSPYVPAEALSALSNNEPIALMRTLAASTRHCSSYLRFEVRRAADGRLLLRLSVAGRKALEIADHSEEVALELAALMTRNDQAVRSGIVRLAAAAEGNPLHARDARDSAVFLAARRNQSMPFLDNDSTAAKVFKRVRYRPLYVAKARFGLAPRSELMISLSRFANEFEAALRAGSGVRDEALEKMGDHVRIGEISEAFQEAIDAELKYTSDQIYGELGIWLTLQGRFLQKAERGTRFSKHTEATEFVEVGRMFCDRVHAAALESPSVLASPDPNWFRDGFASGSRKPEQIHLLGTRSATLEPPAFTGK